MRMSGSSVVAQAVNGQLTVPYVPFEFLGIFTVNNSTDADYRPAKWLGMRLGYQYSNRHVGSIQSVNVGGPQPEEPNRKTRCIRGV